MFQEHEQIVFTAGLTGDDGEELRLGDIGGVVHVHSGGATYVVEFLALNADTASIATVFQFQARPVTSSDMTHSRHVAILA